MFNRVSSLVLSILLFIVLMSASASIEVLAASILVLILCALAINYKRLGLTWPHLLLPCFYLIGTASVFAIMTNHSWRLVFLILATIFFYVMEMELGRESHLLQNIFLFSVFEIFVGLFAVQFYLHLSYIWITIIMFVVSYFLIIQGFAGFSLPVKKYFSFLITLVCAETAWALSWWPTYFVVDAIIAFAIFYLLWIFSFSAFFGKLSKNKIYWQLSLVLLVVIVVLATTNFRPLNR